MSKRIQLKKSKPIIITLKERVLKILTSNILFIVKEKFWTNKFGYTHGCTAGYTRL